MDIYVKQKMYVEKMKKIKNEILTNFEEAFEVEYTYNSTSIEGNTCTLIETKAILEDNISIGGKKLREIFEIVNHQKAYKYIKEKILDNKELSEEIMKDIHQIVNEKILNGGIYRNETVKIVGASHKPPVGLEMFDQIRAFYEDMERNRSLGIIEYIAWVHAEFVRIHPFIDGNGRVSRLIMNYELIRNGFPAISVPYDKRIEYYEALDVYGAKKDIEPFKNFIIPIIEERLDEYIAI